MKYWSAEYSCIIGPWRQNLRAMISYSMRALTLVNELSNPALSPKNPFSGLRGVSVSTFSSEDLWYVLAEIERPLPYHRRWIFFRVYYPVVRVIIPDASSRDPVGVLVADLAEQKKLSRLFREALSKLEEEA